MKTLFTMFLICIFTTALVAQSGDYVQKSEFQQEKKKIYDGMNATRKPMNEMRIALKKQSRVIDSLTMQINEFSDIIAKNKELVPAMTSQVKELGEELHSHKSRSSNHMLIAFTITYLVLIISFITLYILQRRNNREVEETKKQVTKVTEELAIELGHFRDALSVFRNEMENRVKEAENGLSGRLNSFESKLQDWKEEVDHKIIPVTGKLDDIEQRLNKTREALLQVSKELGEKILSSQNDTEQKLKSVNVQLAELKEKRL